MDVVIPEKELIQYLIFRVGDQEYGTELNQVSIIEKDLTYTRVPTTPDYIKGVVNLRGDIFPILSIRLKFGLPEIEVDDDTRIVIFNINESMLGIIVDAVREVVHLSKDDIESAGNITDDKTLDYISGVVKKDERLITLLNLEKLVAELLENRDK
ncbi:MAG: chemotaxis protein CheW [Clostridiaceae bacterium]|jgi:purine-binding chemotaxis protein CheW|nr:chemotaxis protein CheW [Clostridiaceae bacterium]